MSFPRLPLRLSPAAVVLGAAASAAILIALAPMARASLSTDVSGVSPPPPTPTPVNAFLTLDITAGGANISLTVNGSAFLPGETINLYWDVPAHVAGATTANSAGGFGVVVKPFAGDSPGLHRICVTEPPGPCANFTLQGPPTPTPPPISPSVSEPPSSSASPGQAASGPRLDANLNGFDLSKPPFVFMPIIAGVFLFIALAYWVFTMARQAALRPRARNLPTASVVHRATRPDYAAGFGTAPPTPAEPVPPPSAWADVLPATPPTPPAVPPTAASEPPVDPWAGPAPEPPPPDLPTASDEPPDLPEPGE